MGRVFVFWFVFEVEEEVFILFCFRGRFCGELGFILVRFYFFGENVGVFSKMWLSIVVVSFVFRIFRVEISV